MHIPYNNFDHFLEKSEILTKEMSLSQTEGRQLLARISGYDDVDQSTIEAHSDYSDLCLSREELVARLLALHPSLATQRAEMIVDRLRLPTRDTDMEHIRQSEAVKPNVNV